MIKLFKIAKHYEKKLSSLVPALEMATTFGRVMGPLLDQSSSDLADLVAPALKNAAQEDLQSYNLPEQNRIANIFSRLMKANGPEYAADEKRRQQNTKYNQEESLSWIAQEVMAKARGHFDNERQFGPEGRFM